VFSGGTAEEAGGVEGCDFEGDNPAGEGAFAFPGIEVDPDVSVGHRHAPAGTMHFCSGAGRLHQTFHRLPDERAAVILGQLRFQGREFRQARLDDVVRRRLAAYCPGGSAANRAEGERVDIFEKPA